jgi:hypothetical protein
MDILATDHRGRNPVHRGGVDEGIVKERYKLQPRFEAFNTPTYGQPDSNPGDGSFGQITSSGNV